MIQPQNAVPHESLEAHTPHDQQFEQLYTGYQKMVRAIISRAIPEHAYRNEAEQELWLRVLESLRRGVDAADPKAWLQVAARNTAVQYRGREVAPDRQNVSIDTPSVGDNGEETGFDLPVPVEVIDAGMKDDMRAAVDRLTPPLRDVVNGHYYAGLSVTQLAIEMSVPVGTIKRRLHDARQSLTRMLLPNSHKKAA